MSGSFPQPRTSEEAVDLPGLAAKCRRLADAISDGPTRDSLVKLAEEYERQSLEARKSLPRQ